MSIDVRMNRFNRRRFNCRCYTSLVVVLNLYTWNRRKVSLIVDLIASRQHRHQHRLDAISVIIRVISNEWIFGGDGKWDFQRFVFMPLATIERAAERIRRDFDGRRGDWCGRWDDRGGDHVVGKRIIADGRACLRDFGLWRALAILDAARICHRHAYLFNDASIYVSEMRNCYALILVGVLFHGRGN